jgi:chorismate dehydratase
MQRKRLGVSSSLYCLPLVHDLRTDEHFELIVGAATKHSIALREHDLDAALLSPIDYARGSSEYTIIPGIAISSREANETVVLHFRQGIHNITTLAVDPSSTSEIVLATILLGEQFDLAPKIVPVIGSLDVMLQKADAALLVGDAAFMESGRRKNKLDLIEEWDDITSLPFVHALWCCREDGLSLQEIQRIQEAKERGMHSLAEIGAEASVRSHGLQSADAVQQYLESFSYTLTEEVRGGLNEFIRYAYYRGILPDVADLHFYGADRDSDSPTLSLN